MSQNLRKQVLKCFKSLHRTRQNVFQGDSVALEKGRLRINDEYKKCKNISDQEKIKELLVFSKNIEEELVKTVIQAKQVAPGRYQLNIRKETIKLDNVPFKDCNQ